MAELLYKDLCYQLVGFAYKINDALGSGLREKSYADAFEKLLAQNNIEFKREFYYPVKVDNIIIGRNFFDFLIRDELIVELKSGSEKYKEVCNQVFQYLRSSGLKLGLVIRFTRDGVKVKRIPNLY